MEGLLPLLRLRFSYCLASRLDTCQNSYSGRLNGSRASINGTGLRCVKNDFYAISIFRYKSSPLCRVIFKCSVRVLCVVPSGRLITPGYPASDVGPNITGFIGNNLVEMLSISGAFQATTSWDNNLQGGSSGTPEKGVNISFDASRSTYIFGKSSSVQPAALCLLPCIKT